MPPKQNDNPVPAPAKRKRGRPAGSKNVPTLVVQNQTAASPLLKMASRRVPNACKAILLCGNMAAYKPSDLQKRAILGALREALKTVETRFEAAATKSGIVFQLPE